MEFAENSRILLIDDNPGDAQLIAEMLSESGGRPEGLVHVDSLASGLARLSSDRFDCILLNLYLPDSQGIDTYIKVRARTDETAIVVLAELHDEQIALTLFRKGIQDYLNKEQLTGDLLHRTICYARERIRAKAQLISSESRFRKCMNHITDAVIVLSADGIVQFVNPAAALLFGTSRDKLLGTQFGFPITSDDSMEIEIFDRTDNPKIAEMRVSEIEWEGNPANLLSIRNVTIRRKMEKVLIETAARLKQSMKELTAANKKILETQKAMVEEERLKVLLQMAGATAHELNQPLMAMLGNIELLNDPGNTPEKIKDFIDEINLAGRRIANTVNKIQHIRNYETRPYPESDGIINFDQKIKLLSIEDSDTDFEIIRSILEKMDQVLWARALTLEKAMKKLKKEKFDLILLDHILPDGNSFDFLLMLNKNDIKVPVIVVTGQGDEIIASQVIRQGACDYLPKNKVTKGILFRIIKNTIEKTHLENEIKQVQDRLVQMANKDELTGLYNRRFCLDAVKNEVAKDNRHERGLVLSMMDLDHFKQINDTHGHAAGDMVLKEFSRILKENFREIDIVCRYGGEEFIVIMPNTDIENGRRICERLRERVSSHPFEHNTTRFQVTMSTGVVEYIEMMDLSSEDLIKRADAAMYQAKNGGRNRVQAIPYLTF